MRLPQHGKRITLCELELLPIDLATETARPYDKDGDSIRFTVCTLERPLHFDGVRVRRLHTHRIEDLGKHVDRLSNLSTIKHTVSNITA